MNIGLIIAVFLLGVIIGAVGIMVIACLVVDDMKRTGKRELTKEEWKMGLTQDNINKVHPLWFITMTIVLGIMMYVIAVIGNR